MGTKALKELFRLKYIPIVSDEDLEKLSDYIYLAVVGPGKENMSFFPAENARYWPQYYYSFPYNYKYGGAWPPGMYSRLRNWSPGFYAGSGLSYYMRPGMGYNYWPRSRWIRHTHGGKNSYYFLSNLDDYKHNAANYTDTPLNFHS